MNLNIFIIIFLTALSTFLGLSLLGHIKTLKRIEKDRDSAVATCDKVLDANALVEQRMSDIQKFHADMLNRPVQTMIPRDAIEILGQQIIKYLSDSLSGPMEVPIIPRIKEPQK